MARRGSDDHGIQYVHSFSPSPRSVLFLAVSISLLLSVLALILFLNNVSFFFPQTHFYPTFLYCCGAVFNNAGAFNGNLSAWQVGKVTTMSYSTYTYTLFPPPSPRSGLFLAASISPFSFCAGINSLFEQCSLLFIFQTIFILVILGLFFVAVVVQCLPMLVPSMVISPPGRSGKWRSWKEVRTLFPPLSPGSLFWQVLFSFFCTNSIFEQSLLIFFTLFSSLDFSLLLLLWCSVLASDCLQWWSLHMAGRESDEHGIKYVHSFPLSSRSGLFLAFVSVALIC